MSAFYNEIDPDCAEWLRRLSDAGEIAQGHVDERSISEIHPRQLKGFRQCHLFAGVGGWPLALRIAGWPAALEVWTRSCPCQPFSLAGNKRRHDDHRDLWPHFLRLVRERRPAVLLGEQVAGKFGVEWLARVRSDLEGSGYRFGAADLPAACVGAPHIRQRLYWAADLGEGRTGLADADGAQPPARRGDPAQNPGPAQGEGGAEHGAALPRGGGQDGAWSGGRVVRCSDGHSRRVGPGVQPLANGVPAVLGRALPGDMGMGDLDGVLSEVLVGAARNLRMRNKAYGNAVVPQLAAVFVRSYMEAAGIS